MAAFDLIDIANLTEGSPTAIIGKILIAVKIDQVLKSTSMDYIHIHSYCDIPLKKTTEDSRTIK